MPGLLYALSSSVSQIAAPSHAGAFATELQSSSIFINGITDFQNNKSYSSNKPKAYLNWVLVDEQFKLVESSSSAEQVGDNEEFKIHTKSNLPINKNGYLYIYVSNETPNIDVFFDNLQVTHLRGPILEESHYYPFGLTMAGISSKALNEAIENKYKFNGGTELNSTFDVNLYETFFRSYDPQIGRFHQIDPLTESTSNWSAYSFVQNNPLLYLDPLGLDTVINGQNHQWNGGFLDDVIISGKNEGWVIDASGGWDNNSDPFYQSWKLEQNNWQRGIKVGGFGDTRGEEKISSKRKSFEWGWGLPMAVGAASVKVSKKIKDTRVISNAWYEPPVIKGPVTVKLPIGRTFDISRGALSKISTGLKIGGVGLGAIGIGGTMYDIGTGTKNLIGEGGLDLLMGGVGFIPVWGWAASGIYFGGKALLEYTDNDFWNR